jgi:hypothetical protein
MSADVLPPGGEGEIKVTLDPKGRTKIHKRILVYSNDPERPQFALTLQGTVLVDLIAKPRMVSIPELSPGKSGRTVFSLHRTEGSTADVRSVRVEDEESFSVRRIQTEADAHATYEVRFRGRDTAGTSSTHVIVETSGENTPELSIPVRATAVTNLRYTDHIRFVRKEGRVQPRTVRISARRGDAPRIGKVEDPDGLLEIEVLPSKGSTASLRLTLLAQDAEAVADEAWHPLVVHTDDREQPRLELRYRVEPERPARKRAKLERNK